MARQRNVPTLSPSLPPERSIPILEKLVIDAEKLFQEHRHSPKRQEWINTTEAALQAALGSTNPAIDAFSLAQCGSYSPRDSEQKLQKQSDNQVRGMIAAVNSGVQQLRWKLPDPTQVFVPAGSTHDAYVEVRKLCATATQSITNVDSYVDDTLWPLLKNLSATVAIRILTAQMKGDFALEGKKFAAQHGNAVEVRTTKSYHDRFILLDGTKCWHLGASIKDAGNKAFLMSEVLSPALVATVLTDVQITWDAGSVVPL
jgi:hypothetical protein